MAMTPDELYARVQLAADDEGRLPLSRMTGWDIFPFEQEGLRLYRWHHRKCPSLPVPNQTSSKERN